MTPQEIGKLIAARLDYIFPGATRIEVAENTGAIYLDLPNGQTFRIQIEERDG